LHKSTLQILEELLSWVPTADLLRTCRLVNRTWKAFATTFCYQRRVKLNFKKLDKSSNSKRILDTFLNVQQLPWSACKVNLRERRRREKTFGVDKDKSTVHDYLTFLYAFGSGIQELALKADDFEAVIDTVQLIPNVQKLTICCDDEKKKAVPPYKEETKEIQLLKLKEFQFKTPLKSYATPLKFMKLIHRSSPRLKTVSLCFSVIFLDMEQWAPLLSNIPFINLEFAYSPVFMEPMNILLDANCKRTTELKIIIGCLPTRTTRKYYHPLERFLSLNSGHLKKLTILYAPDFHPGPDERRRFLKIPPLPKLKYLQFGDCEALEFLTGRTKLGFPFSTFVPFTANHFPVLEKVNIGPHTSTFGVFNGSTFKSVKSLWVEHNNYNFIQTDWGRIFPQLKELTTWADEASLIYIFRNMSKLEKLCLSVRVNTNASHTTANSVLSGIPYPGKYCKESKERIQELRDTHGNPSLLNMTSKLCLKKVYGLVRKIVDMILNVLIPCSFDRTQAFGT